MKYKTKIKCNNCGETMVIEVPMENLVKEYVRKKSILCPNCEHRII